MKKMFRRLTITILVLLICQSAFALVKIRDMANVDGIRDNQLYGYGIVIGLNGTGDKSGTEFTLQSLSNMLDKMGIKVDKAAMKVKNVAAVIVTAKLPPFVKPGSKIDIVVSSLGDAKSLEGGTLLMTPLKAADGQVYAVAQGPISVGGIAAGGGGATKNHPTVGMIPNGALVERSVKFDLDETGIVLNFKNISIEDIVRAKNTINTFYKGELASIKSPTTLKVKVPAVFRSKFYEFLNSVLSLKIQPSDFAKVVVDERTGTIVMGKDVKISTVAVSHGNLTITISSTEKQTVDENGNVQTETQTNVNVEEEKSRLIVLPQGITISDLVKALNSIGVTPRDLISILQAIKAAGALHGNLEVM